MEDKNVQGTCGLCLQYQDAFIPHKIQNWEVPLKHREVNNFCYLNNGSDKNIYALGDSSLRSITYWLARNSEVSNFNFTSITGSACLFNAIASLVQGQ